MKVHVNLSVFSKSPVNVLSYFHNLKNKNKKEIVAVHLKLTQHCKSAILQ